jgi:hypothetical protein
MPKILKHVFDRRHRRLDFNRTVFILYDLASPLFECTLLDISDGGARLEVGTLNLPQTFILLLTPDAGVRRFCRQAWRRGTEVGVKFVKPKLIDVAPEAANAS